MYEIMYDMKTLVKKKSYKYKSISNGDKEIFFGKNQTAQVNLSKAQYIKLLDAFKGQTILVGPSTNPPEDSLGKWLINNITKQAIASYIVPILLLKGHSRTVVPFDSGKIKFTVVKFGECSNCRRDANMPLIPFASYFLCARCIRHW